MRKLLVGLVVVALLAGAALVAPSFIDWNRYKPEIAARVQEATGRALTVEGGISARLLPSPALTAGAIRLANPAGAAAPDLVRLKGLSVGVALWPLLRGTVEVTGIVLDQPVIELETLVDGRETWDLTPAAGKAAPGSPGPGRDEAGAGPAIRFDSVAIRGGTVVWRDTAKGTVERFEAIDADLKAASLQGPADARGRLTWRGTPLKIEAAVGQMTPGRPASLTASVALEKAKASAKFTGSVDPAEAQVKGRLEAGGEDLGAALAALGLDAPPVLGRTFSLEARVEADDPTVGVNDLRLVLGDITATGAVSAVMGDKPKVDAALQVNRLDLDRLLGETKAGPAPKAQTPAPGTTAPGAPAKAAAGIELPRGLAVRLDLGVAALVWRDGVVQKVHATLALDDGRLTIERAEALLPGGTALKVSGTARTAPKPAFDGRIDGSADNLRALLAWLDADPAEVPADRLRKLQLAAKVDADAEVVRVANLDLRLDSSRITGGAAFALRARPSFSLNLAIDRLNLDGYVGANAKTQSKPDAKPAAPAKQGKPTPQASDGDHPLNRFDTNAKVRIGELLWDGTAARNVELDVALLGGKLDIKRAAVGDLAGTAASLSGKAEARRDGLRYDLSLSAEGRDLPRTLKALGIDYRPTGHIAGFRITTPVAGSPDRIALKGFKASVGPAALEGDLAVVLTGPRPKLTADLKASDLPVDAFVPAAAAAVAAPARAAGNARARAPTAPGQRWSREPHDLAYLRAFDAEVKVAARGLAYGGYQFREPRLNLSLDNGTLKVRELKGALFDGAVDLTATVVTAPAQPATAVVDVTLSNADLRRALITALEMNQVSGRFGMKGRFESKGNSDAELIGNLQGNAAIDARDGVIEGINLRHLSDRLKRLNEVPDFLGLIGGTLSGGQTRFSRATGTWVIERGVARTNDTQAALEAAEGQLAGIIDLPNWRLDLQGAMRLIEHPQAPPVGIHITGPIDAPQRNLKTRELEAYLSERIGGAILRKLGPKQQQPPGTTQPQTQTPQSQPGDPREQLLRDLLKAFPRR